MGRYFEGVKQVVGSICTLDAAATVFVKGLSKEAAELLFYFCSGGFLALGLLTRRGHDNQAPAQVAPPPPPPGQHALAANKARRAAADPRRPPAPGQQAAPGAGGRRAAMIQTPGGVTQISFAHDNFDEYDYYYEEESSLIVDKELK